MGLMSHILDSPVKIKTGIIGVKSATFGEYGNASWEYGCQTDY